MALAWKRWLVVLGVVLGVRLLNPVNVAVVDGRSMEPAMHDGQFFLIDRLRYRFVPVARG
jgi:signal peptidase I